MKKSVLLLIVLNVICFTAHAADQLPTVDNPWLRAGPPNANMLAAYVTLTNESDEKITLVSADSDAFGMTEIHRTIEVDGVFKMREQDALPINVGESLTMAPGGLHIMLMMPQQTIVIGESVDITLTYHNEAGQTRKQTITFDVKASQ